MNRKSFILFILLFGLCSVCYGQVGTTKHYLNGEVLIATSTDAGAYVLQVTGNGYFGQPYDGFPATVFHNLDTGANSFAGISVVSDGGTSSLYRGSIAAGDDTYLHDQGGGDIIIQGAAEVARFANGGNITHAGFTAMGTGNTGLKCKVITGTADGAEGATSATAHGLDYSKIVSVSIMQYDGSGNYYFPGDFGAGVQYAVRLTSTVVVQANHPTESEGIVGQTWTATIWYKE